MENEIILTAPTVEEAMADARAKYGDEYELTFSILEMPKKGFLGLGAAPAKVKVTLTKALPDVDLSSLVSDLRSMKMEDTPAVERREAPAKAQKTPDGDSTPAALKTPVKRQDDRQKKNKTEKKNDRPADTRPAAEKKDSLLSAVRGVKGEKKGEDEFCTVTEKTVVNDARWDRPAKDPAKGKDRESAKAEDTRRVEFVTPQEMEFALNFANTLFDNMKLPARAVHNPDAKGETVPEGMLAARIDIVGDDSGILIGHHGETLDALQYLLNLCASRNSDSAKREFVKIAVDVEGYRAKREETLRSLARRMGAKALKYRRDMVLEPMNPYERRIIHSEIQGMENLSTHSVGSDENRKIVIVYEGEDAQPKKKSRRRRRGDRGDKGERREHSAKATETVTVKMSRPDTPRAKPVRAKSIDEIRLDLSEASTLTIGEVGASLAAAEDEEQLREF